MEKTPEQKERDNVRNAAIRTAKETVRSFFANKLFSKLPENLQEALKILAPTARLATSTLSQELRDLFGEKTMLTELEVFKALKVGPNEFKAKVNHVLKQAIPEERMWISYDPTECTWTLVATGASCPTDFRLDNLIPSVQDYLDHPDFEAMTISQLIAGSKAPKEAQPE